jgi:GT2 family glycosyltransferase
MSTFVADIEISEALPKLALPAGTQGLFALVRSHGRPVGLLRLPDAQGVVTPTQLAAAIETQLARTVPWPAPQTPLLPGERGFGQDQDDGSAAAPPSPPEVEEGRRDEGFHPISIIVCTHERPADLARCLTALVPLAAAGHEVIVVDNAPRSGRTAQVAARFPFRYLVEPRQGLDHARNCGLHAANHAIVAYIDDDAVADPAWAEAIAAPFADPAVACVTGLVLPLELQTSAQVRFELYCTNRRTFTRRAFRAPGTAPAAAGVAGMGANMALRHAVALQLGGFDPRLDAGTATCSGGDTDMFARVLDAGSTIVYTPDALVWHRHRREEAELRRCLFGYGVGLYALLTKRVVEERDLGALVIGVRWWGGPIVKAAWATLRGRPALPAILLAYEAAGALVGPLRFWIETRREALPTVVISAN